MTLKPSTQTRLTRFEHSCAFILRRQQWTSWALVGVLLLTALVFAFLYFRRGTQVPRILRVSVLPPENATFNATSLPAISPDGRSLAFVVTVDQRDALWVRDLDSLAPRRLPGTEGAYLPFWSPDGRFLGFFSRGKLKKIDVAGGSVLSLCDAPAGRGGSWSKNDVILFAPNQAGGLFRVPAGGGSATPVIGPDRGLLQAWETTYRFPWFLPDGRHFLYHTIGISGPDKNAVYVADLESNDSKTQRQLLTESSNAVYAPPGYLLFLRGGTLMAQPFDAGTAQTTGDPVPIAEQIDYGGELLGQFSSSQNGVLAYTSHGRLVWVDRKGAEQLVGVPKEYRSPQVSPDGRRVAVTIEEVGGQIWIYDLGREVLARLTFDEGSGNVNPVWAPDGKRVAFPSGTPPNLFWQPADGSGKAERLTTSEYNQAPSSWSPDGQMLAFEEVNSTTGFDIWILRLSDRKARPFLRTPSNERAPRFSPDGRWLAYVSDESGPYEIYVLPYPGPGEKWQISTDGGTEPVWNPNGRELFYRNGNKVMAVDVATQPSFSAGKPRMLFEGGYVPAPGALPNYDVTPDGQRFLMIKASQQGTSETQIIIVLNWLEELKQKVPTGKK
jgi:eukaryotic-like serine/threonine-protein kinase